MKRLILITTTVVQCFFYFVQGLQVKLLQSGNLNYWVSYFRVCVRVILGDQFYCLFWLVFFFVILFCFIFWFRVSHFVWLRFKRDYNFWQMIRLFLFKCFSLFKFLFKKNNGFYGPNMELFSGCNELLMEQSPNNIQKKKIECLSSLKIYGIYCLGRILFFITPN